MIKYTRCMAYGDNKSYEIKLSLIKLINISLDHFDLFHAFSLSHGTDLASVKVIRLILSTLFLYWKVFLNDSS